MSRIPRVAGQEVPKELISEWYKKLQDETDFEDIEVLDRNLAPNPQTPLKRNTTKHLDRLLESLIKNEPEYWRAASNLLWDDEYWKAFKSPYVWRIWELYCEGKYEYTGIAAIISEEFGTQIKRTTVNKWVCKCNAKIRERFEIKK